jgi:hypothetical protein
MKKEVKSYSAPTGVLNTNNLSIKQSLRENINLEETTAAEDLSNRPQKLFSIDELKMVWRQFAYKIKQEGIEGADSMNLALTKRDPKMPGLNQIHQEFDNQIQIDMMKNHFYASLLEFLRTKLQNWSITIEFSLIENQEDNNKHLSGRNKFEILARKNTNLLTLQKTFNLDIEY